jgi:hypothetical protein
MSRIYKLMMIVSLGCFYSMGYSQAQNVGIGTTNPHASSVLDIKSPDGKKGLLIPVMNHGDRESIKGIAKPGLLVYDETLNQFCFFDGSAWRTINQMSQPAGTAPQDATHNGDLNVSGTVSSNTITAPTVNGTTINAGTLNATTVAASNYQLNFGNGPIPQGGIIMWSGAIADIPLGWTLCDGKPGTPDLRDRFVIGSGPGFIGGTYGGSTTNSLGASNLPPHSHGYSKFKENSNDWKGGGNSSPGDGTGGNISASTDNGPGFSAPFSIVPPYYAIAFIMKL